MNKQTNVPRLSNRFTIEKLILLSCLKNHIIKQQSTQTKKMCCTEVKDTAQNTEISPNFLISKFCGSAQVLQNFHIMKLSEIAVVYTVRRNSFSC